VVAAEAVLVRQLSAAEPVTLAVAAAPALRVSVDPLRRRCQSRQTWPALTNPKPARSAPACADC